MATRLQLGDIAVDVVLKDIRNVHLSVYPPLGQVRISAPRRMSLDTIRVFAISKLEWIRRQQRKLQEQERETPREYLDRESHFAWGKRYLFAVVEGDAAPEVELEPNRMVLRVRSGTDAARREALIAEWYREQVKRAAPPLIAEWDTVLPGHAAGCPAGVMLTDGREIPADAVIAATGVRPAPWLAASGLALADDGFVAVGDGQRGVSHPSVFAAGDVASRVDAPHAKSGVYAVPAGPVLAANLDHLLAGRPCAPYRPQRRSLYLLATGPREAIMSWNGVATRGTWVWRWKDWIDRGFMRRFDTVGM